MTEQQTTDLLARITALEKQHRRMQLRLAFAGMLLTVMFVLLVPDKVDALRNGQWDLWLGKHDGVTPHVSLSTSDDRSLAYLTSDRSTTTSGLLADPDEARLVLTYGDAARVDVNASKEESALSAEGSAGQAKASATPGFYLYDKDGTLRAELSLAKQQPALIFYDAKGKELRRLRATKE